MKANQEIREALCSNGIPQWRLAEKVGVSPNYFCVLLRQELNVERKLQLLEIIDEIISEKEA